MAGEARRIMAKWEKGHGIAEEDLLDLERDLENLVDAELGRIKDLAGAGKPTEALGQLTKLNAFASSALSQQPSLISVLSQRVEAFRAALDKMGGLFGAAEFSIEFGIPSGISVSLTFTVTERLGGSGGGPASPDAT